ncbi:MAG: DUF6526 family protein [Gemmatimonadaceae bacterium]
MPKVQTYKNHRRYHWLHHFIVQPILIANFALELSEFIEAPGRDAGWALIVATGLMLFAFTARSMVLTAQNRVIRLEEKLRLSSLMPPEERSRIDELRTGQFVGLRFASDAEVVDLARRCLSGELKSSNDVKKNISEWRPDHLRV